MHNWLLHHCYHGCTDATQICFYCHASECTALKGKVLTCIGTIADWMKISKLHLSPSESAFVWCPVLGICHRISKECFTLADDSVQLLGSVHNLGAFLDSDINMKMHVNRLMSSCYYQLQRMQSIRQSIPTNLLLLPHLCQNWWTSCQLSKEIWQKHLDNHNNKTNTGAKAMKDETRV